MTGETQDGLKAAVLGAVECVNKSYWAGRTPYEVVRSTPQPSKRPERRAPFAANLMLTFWQPPAHVRAQIIVGARRGNRVAASTGSVREGWIPEGTKDADRHRDQTGEQLCGPHRIVDRLPPPDRNVSCPCLRR